MNARYRFCVLPMVLFGVLVAGQSAAQPLAPPPQFGDRQAGSFGDISQGYFGNTAEGNFTEKQYSRRQESQVPQVDALPLRSSQGKQAKPSKNTKSTDSPYVTLPKPLDAQ